MLNGAAADNFALERGIEEVEQEWLITDLRKAQWQKWKDAKSRLVLLTKTILLC